jgi:hypothetical protein
MICPPPKNSLIIYTSLYPVQVVFKNDKMEKIITIISGCINDRKKKKTPLFFFFFDISAQEEDGGFELVTSASLDMVPAN